MLTRVSAFENAPEGMHRFLSALRALQPGAGETALGRCTARRSGAEALGRSGTASLRPLWQCASCSAPPGTLTTLPDRVCAVKAAPQTIRAL